MRYGNNEEPNRFSDLISHLGHRELVAMYKAAMDIKGHEPAMDVMAYEPVKPRCVVCNEDWQCEYVTRVMRVAHGGPEFYE